MSDTTAMGGIHPLARPNLFAVRRIAPTAPLAAGVWGVMLFIVLIWLIPAIAPRPPAAALR